MAILIRPEEKSRKVLVKVNSTYPFQKELGENHRVSLDTNRKGGVLVPFIRYAEAWMDPDLEFYDPDTGERLGTYYPPKDSRTEEIELLLEGIRDVLNATTQPRTNESSELLKALKDFIGTPESVITPNHEIQEVDPSIINKVANILNLPWRERKAEVEKIALSSQSSVVLRQIRDDLESKSSLGKTNREILKVIKEKLGE